MTIPVLGLAFARNVSSIPCSKHQLHVFVTHKDCICMKITDNRKWRCFKIKNNHEISRKIILTVHFMVTNYMTLQGQRGQKKNRL